MIKVAHLMKYYLGQSETFIWQYLHRFEKIYPIVMAYRLQNLDQFPLVNGTTYSILGRRGSVPWFLNNWYRRFLGKPFGYAERIIKREKVSVLHAHSGFYGAHFLKLSTNLNLPLVTTFYGLDLADGQISKQYGEQYRSLFQRGSLFLVEGPEMRKKLLGLGCPEDKIVMQHIAIDLQNYHFRMREWDGERPVRLLFVGRLVEKKGLEYALEALTIIKNKFSLNLRVIGDGELNQFLRARAQELGLSQEVIWCGMKPHRDVIREIEACDILIQPSITAQNGDSEGGAPTILLEAQACGAPIISTKHADIPYVTVPGKSALLSDEKDVSGLARNLSSLLENPNKWPEMGQFGRDRVARFHDVRKEIVKLIEKYIGLC
jgi:colanic acid/amylovoran biosynthesis glycosyltransferase